MTRKVALIIDAAKPYDRKIIQGVADYVQERGGWTPFATQAGVGSVQYLSAIFSARLGMPPGEYRRSFRG